MSAITDATKLRELFGEKITEGKPEAVAKNPLVIKAYLGEGE